MKKSNLYWFGMITSAFVLAIVAMLTILIKHEPNFYRQSQVAPSERRKDLAKQFLQHFLQMMLSIKGREETWSCDATEEEINCFFQETFVQMGEAESLRKLGIDSPSVTLEKDQLRLAFRYGKGWFSTIITYDLKVWLVAKEPNVVAVQILSARAGAMPISCQSILYELSEFAGKQNYKVALFRYKERPVAIVSLQPEQPNPTSTLCTLQFNTNMLTIQGKTSEHALPPINILKASPVSLTR